MNQKLTLTHFKAKFREFAYKLYDYFLQNKKRLNLDNNSKIIFIGEYFPVRIQRLANLVGSDLQLEKVLYISEWGYEPKLIGNAFDRIEIYRNSYDLKRRINSENNIKLIHAFEPKAYFQFKIKNLVRAPFIYDLQDIIVTYYGFNPPLKWQKTNLLYEEKLFHLVDGFIAHSMELNEAQRLYKSRSVAQKRLFFPLFCNSENFKPIVYKKIEDQINLVYIGGINAMKDHSSSNFLPFIKKLKTDVHLTIFPSPFSERLCFEEYKELEQIYPNFTIKHSVPFTQLNLTGFDFGVVPFEHENSEKYYSKNKYASTLKFFVYLEMGLPILISDYWAFPAWITKRYGIGIVTNYENLDKTDFKIDEETYKIMLKNVEQFRNRFTLQANKNRLIEFYNSFLQSDK